MAGRFQHSETGSGRVSRRTVLRSVGATVVGGAGAAAVGSAAAQSSDRDVEVLDLRGESTPALPTDDELLVFAHGWLGTDGAAEQTADLADVLATGGYEADADVAIQWDAETLNYPSAESHTEDVGAELADLVEAYADETDGTIRLVGHSLGGRVVLETLGHLSEGYSIETVAPMGTAADGSTVTSGGRWYDGIAENAGAVRNYHSENDSTVGFAYGGWSDTALGNEGAADPSATPETYTDVDVTDDVGSHSEYTNTDAVGQDLADAILSDDDSGGGEDGDDGADDGGDGANGGDDGSDGGDDGSGDCSWCWW